MNTNHLFRTIVIFVALGVAGVCLIVFGQAAQAEAVKGTLPLVGAAVFGSGLTYFLLEVTRLQS
jgi:drug/metabolite transporter (DMT)-like permease